MPRIPRRRQAGDPFTELTKGQRFALLSAGPRIGAQFARWPADDPEPWQTAWEIHGPELLAEFIYKKPGFRPWPWFCWDCDRERPIQNPVPAEMEARLRAQYTYFGTLVCDIEHGHGLTPWLEPQTDFLRRHGLLTPAEIAALEADDAQADDDEAFDD